MKAKTESQAVSNVKSAARFADILEFVAESPQAPSFAEIAAGLELPKSSLFHLLGTLAMRGYLEQTEIRGGYKLGPSIAKLAQRMKHSAIAGNTAQIAVKRLRELINESSAYYERVGNEVEVICAESARQNLVYMLTTGDRAPMYCTSAGKILLANMPDSEVRTYIKQTAPTKFTPNTLTSPTAILKELKKVREAGYAYSREEYSLGIIGVATAVKLHGTVVGALTIAVPAVRLTPELDNRIRLALAQAAASMEREG